MTALSPDTGLDALRREIDAIDDAILDLLARRFAATGKVKSAKAKDGSIASSPFRPAREAAMLRRLIGRGRDAVPPETLVRLWRVILSSSTQSQAPVGLHMDRALGLDLDARLLVSGHFCGMEVNLHDSPAQAITALGRKQGDLAILALDCDWATGFVADEASGAGVVLALPVIGNSLPPRLLVFGHAAPAPSGDDETLVVSSASIPIGSSVLWQARAGQLNLTGLSGFLLESDPFLQEILGRLPGARVAGRYPRPIEVFP